MVVFLFRKSQHWVCNSSTHEAEAEVLQVQGHHGLHDKIEASHNYEVRLSLKK